jgi:hypothetical protein
MFGECRLHVLLVGEIDVSETLVSRAAIEADARDVDLDDLAETVGDQMVLFAKVC